MSEITKASQELPRFADDPNQYSEAELLLDPAKRFHVNPKDFPIFSKQAELGPNWGNAAETLPIDETVGRYVQSTADCIAVLAGEDKGIRPEGIPAADHIIYLDKSARPVCWLNNVFWDAFTEKPRPPHSFLAIDRYDWFMRTGTDIDKSKYVKDKDGITSHLATFRDFRTENVSNEDIARIRALFIPDGIEEEDAEKIIATPTNLEGKNITIIDEVSLSGSTLEIAKYLISRAIPEAASVNGYTYWKPGTQTSKDGDSQMRGAPVWYDELSNLGRGIGDVDESFYADRYKRIPNPKTRAQKYGSIVLGKFINLSKEPGNKSRQLMKEIITMRKEWDAGHILMSSPSHYDDEKWAEHLEGQGVQFAPVNPNKRLPKNSYQAIRRDIHSRPPAEI